MQTLVFQSTLMPMANVAASFTITWYVFCGVWLMHFYLGLLQSRHTTNPGYARFAHSGAYMGTF